MPVQVEASDREVRTTETMRRVLLGATAACLVGAGLLLWSGSGEAVFSTLVLSALAWCF